MAHLNGDTTWVFPCIYIILTHKNAPIYKEAFEALDSPGSFSPDNIMVDYELALRNTQSDAFSSSEVDGCYFHFCQAVMGAVFMQTVHEAKVA